MGAFIGGLLGTRLGWGKVDAGDLDLRSIAIATFGAIVLLALGRLVLRVETGAIYTLSVVNYELASNEGPRQSG